MIDFLHSFGCGIAFAFGILLGIGVSMMAMSKSRREAMDHSAKVLAKLTENVAIQSRIATAIESIESIKRRGE